MNSTKDIRDILFKQMEILVNGKTDKDDIAKARTVCDMASQIVYSTRVEVENKKIELELAKSDKEVKKWLERDFSNIQDIKL